jgi:hypothetical protein
MDFGALQRAGGTTAGRADTARRVVLWKIRVSASNDGKASPFAHFLGLVQSDCDEGARKLRGKSSRAEQVAVRRDH